MLTINDFYLSRRRGYYYKLKVTAIIKEEGYNEAYFSNWWR